MWIKARYQGVRYRESIARTIRVKGHTRPDRCFYIYYKICGKAINEKVGWESEGVNANQARDVRGEILVNIRTAEGFQSLKEKRDLDNTRKEQARIKKELAKREDVSFGALAQEYLKWAKDAKKSFKDDESNYRNHLAPLLAKKVAREIGVLDIERIKKTLSKKKVGKKGGQLSPATVKHCIVLTRQIFNYAITRKLFNGGNPVSETLKSRKGFVKGNSNKRTRFLTREEANSLLEKIQESSLQTYHICCSSLYTGLRMGEVFALTWQDLDLTNKLLYVRNPKNDEARQAYLTPNLVGIFKSMPKGKNNCLIFPDRNGKRIDQLSDTFDRAVVKLGLNNGVTDRLNKVVPHTLRHTFASWLAQQGETLLTIKELMGHKNIEMTMRYSHLCPDQKRKAVLELAKNQKKKTKILLRK